jgi:hypothetical protein
MCLLVNWYLFACVWCVYKSWFPLHCNRRVPVYCLCFTCISLSLLPFILSALLSPSLSLVALRQLTHFGRVCAALPVNVHVSRMLMLAALFGELDSGCVLAAVSSVSDVFRKPLTKALDFYQAKCYWAFGSESDLIAVLNVFHEYQRVRRFAPRNLYRWSRENFVELRTLREVDELQAEIAKRLARFGMRVCRFDSTREQLSDAQRADRDMALKVILFGTFFPNFFVSSMLDEPRLDILRKAREGGSLAYRPGDIVELTGIGDIRDPRLVRDILVRAGIRDAVKEVHFEGSAVSVEFPQLDDDLVHVRGHHAGGPRRPPLQCVCDAVFVGRSMRTSLPVYGRGGGCRGGRGRGYTHESEVVRGPFSPLQVQWFPLWIDPQLAGLPSTVEINSVNSVVLDPHAMEGNGMAWCFLELV